MRNTLLLFIALLSFGFAQAQDCSGADHTVLASNFEYNPSVLTITAGETIAFLNEGGFHNVNGVSPTLSTTWNNPETFSLGSNSGSAGGVCMGTVTLNTPGTYNYDCSIGSHAENGMVASIIVEAAVSSTPTDNAVDPTLDAGDVVSIYSGSYDNIAENYNPGWGQSGSVNAAYDPGTGNVVMEYANFNYQGTEVASSDLSGMTHLHVDVWVASDNDRMLKVTPVSGGTGASEFLVEVPLTPGSWNSVDLPKASFTGMTWEQVFQMKFDGQFNADGSGNGAGWDVYLDNIYFWNDGTGSGPPSGETVDVTFNVNMANETVGDSVSLAGGTYFGFPGDNPMNDDNMDGIWTTTIAVPVGYSGNYTFTNGGQVCGWSCKENIQGQSCADGPFSDRLLPVVTQDTVINTCFSECTTDGSCPTPAVTYDATFQVDMSNANLNGDEVIYVTGSFDGWCGPCTNVLTDSGNGVYTGTVSLEPGTYEFKYLINAWGGDETNLTASCGVDNGQGSFNRQLVMGAEDTTLPVQCFDFCGTCEEQNNLGTVDITWNVNMSNEVVSPEGVFLAGGGNFGNPGDNPLTDNGDGIWSITVTVDEGFSSYYIFTNGAAGDYSGKEQLAGLPCGDPNSYNDRSVNNITEDTTFNFCFGECGTDGNCEGGNGGSDPDGPTDNATDPTVDAANVVSIYSGVYTDVATNYNPFWGQSGSVNPAYDPGTGNSVLQYSNFNYQGTELPATDISSMTHLHVDVWVEAGTDRQLKVSPVNAAPGGINQEYLVNVPLTPGSWNSVDLAQSEFVGVTWENIIQMKFDGQFNGDGSANVAGWNVYLDNIYFWNDGNGNNGGGGTDPSDSVAVTFNVDMNNYGSTFGFVNVAGTWNAFCGDCNQMTDEDADGIWTATINLPPGSNYRYKFQVDAWADQEDLAPGDDPVGPCVVKEGGFTNRDLDVDGEDPIVLDAVCWGTCHACIGVNDVAGCNDSSAANYDDTATANDGTCLYDVTFSVNMSEYPLADADSVYVNGEFNGYCGSCNPLLDEDEDGTYTGTLQLASDYYEYKFTVNEWSAQENLAGLGDCVTENFGFTNRVLQLFGNQSQDVVCWNSCSDCESLGDVNGCTDETAVNYSSLANTDDGSCEYPVTFVVDMNEYAGSYTAVNLNGNFAGWCGSCIEMTDDNADNVYEVTVNLTVGTIEYKFTVDGWSDQENFVEGTSCTSTIEGFTNRTLDVTGAATLGVVCWNSCYACDVAAGCTDQGASNYDDTAVADDGSCLYEVVLRLDMSTSTVSDNGVHVAGAFQGWNPGTTPMTSPGLGLYEYTVQLSNGSYQYIYINGNGWEGQESVQAECGADNGQGGLNREFTVAGSNMVLDVVCFGSCTACAGCTDPLSADFSPFAGEDDGSCTTALVFGCTYSNADNYNAAATSEDGSCTFTGGSSCPTDIDGDGSTAVGDLLVILGAFGQTCGE